MARCGDNIPGRISHDTVHRVWNPYKGWWNGPSNAVPFPTTWHDY